MTMNTGNKTSTVKRLIEVDLPIRRISAYARREKTIRHGHISSLHIWWARRPLAACRAVILASLLPDPADPECPQIFRDVAAKALQCLRDKRGGTPRDLSDHNELRHALLDFIADFSNWELSSDPDYVRISRELVQSAHESLGGDKGTRPLVIDPFAGGGAIPLEALRVGADAFASDLNPVAILLNKVVLEYIPKYGKHLAESVRKWGGWVTKQAEKELGRYYPKAGENNATPIAYLWARTVRCEGPECGAEVPLLRSMWLSKRGSRPCRLEIQLDRKKNHIGFSIATSATVTSKVDTTVKRGSAECPLCGYTTPADRVRAQFKGRRGGSRDSRLVAIATAGPGQEGRGYRLPNAQDYKAIEQAAAELERLEAANQGPLSIVPDESLPYLRSIFNIHLLDVKSWGDLFTPRQALTMATLARLVREAPIEGSEAEQIAVRTILAFALDKRADLGNSLTRWEPIAQCPRQLFGRQAIGIVWDFAEASPISGSSGSWDVFVDGIAGALDRIGSNWPAGQVAQADAAEHPLPDDSAHVLVTDPPYYDAVPYADLSDFFYVWLKRTIGPYYPDLFSQLLSPKREEIVQLAERNPIYEYKTKKNFEDRMGLALASARRAIVPNGLAVIVFAHKATSAWETMLQAAIDAGWVMVASWPIDTENESRLRAMNSAVLASSIHLVCRPRENADGSLRDDEIGDYRVVLSELPKRIHEWMPRLAEEGVVGADAIFACLGPALEIFSRYSRVEKVSGEQVPLREYLEHVWAAVAKEALSMIFREADTAGLEEDARLTAMWLWTMAASKDESSNGEDDAPAEDGDEDDDEGRASTKKKLSGFVLEFDAARKIAQGLGARLEQLTHTVEVKGDKARLLPVAERTTYLFDSGGKESSSGKRAAKKKQMSLFVDAVEAEAEATWGDLGEPEIGKTTLDRIHQSMLLFAAGRTEALKRFLVEDGIGRQPPFWKLAQALSALYPSGTDEKRWVDGVLARKKGLGF